eukprot:3845958-Prymnesium_polylepis.1
MGEMGRGVRSHRGGRTGAGAARARLRVRGTRASAYRARGAHRRRARSPCVDVVAPPERANAI